MVAGGSMPTASRIVGTRSIAWWYWSRISPDALICAGQEMMQAYHAAASERREHGVETLFTEKTIKTDMGPFILSGRVDRIDRHPDGTLEVVDYKSGRLETTQEEVSDDLAMNIYQLILRRSYPGSRVMATIYCLRSGVHASAELADAEACAGDFHELFHQPLRTTAGADAADIYRVTGRWRGPEHGARLARAAQLAHGRPRRAPGRALGARRSSRARHAPRLHPGVAEQADRGSR